MITEKQKKALFIALGVISGRRITLDQEERELLGCDELAENDTRNFSGFGLPRLGLIPILDGERRKAEEVVYSMIEKVLE